MYSTVVMGMSKEDLEHRLRAMKQQLGVKEDTAVPAADGKSWSRSTSNTSRKSPAKRFLTIRWSNSGAIRRRVRPWMAEKGRHLPPRRKNHRLLGTAVNVVQMVFGNTGDNSGTGVCFTRDPSSGEKIFYGDYLTNAQGEDVVAGIRTPVRLAELQKIMPKAYAQLEKVRVKLEGHYKDMQDMEFTIEEGKLYMLQTRTGKRTPSAAFKIAMDMATRNSSPRKSSAAHQAGRY